MKAVFHYAFINALALAIIYCQYKIYKVKKKYLKNKNYYTINVNEFEEDDKRKIKFWRNIGLFIPFTYILAIIIELVIF